MSPAVLEEQALTIRQSHLRHLEEHCPAMAWALSVEGREGPQTPEALRGRAVHSLFSRYTQHLYDTGLPSDPQGLPLLLEEVFEEYSSLGFEQRMDVTNQAGKIVVGFDFDAEHFYGTEEAFAMDLELAEGRRATVTGRLDYLEVHAYAGRAVIVDLKSTYYLPPDSRVKEDFQLACYALLVLENLPQVDLVEGRLLFSRYGVSLPQKGEALWSRTDAEHLKAHLRTRLGAHFAGELRSEYRPGDHCGYCPRRRVGDCPLVRSYYGTTPPPPHTERQARKLACQVIALEGARETRLALLKEYVKTRGPLAVGSGRHAEVFAFRESESEEIPAAHFLRILKENYALVGEQDLSELLRVSKTSRSFKHLRRHPDLRAFFDAVAEKRVGSSIFGHQLSGEKE